MGELERANELLKQGQALHCCQFVAYVIYADKSKNQGGANGWKNWGSEATKDTARVIWQDGHVGYVNGGNVYYSSGINGAHKVKSLSDYLKYVDYRYRK